MELFPFTVEPPVNGDYATLDRFGWKTTVEKFQALLKKNLENPLVIAFNAPWGTGKTFFCKWLEQGLPNSIYIPTWKYDHISEPHKLIATKLKQKIQSNPQIVITQINSTFFGVDLNKRESRLGTKGNHLVVREKEIKEVDEFRGKFEAIVKTFCSKVENNQPITFLIDDLDRCEPYWTINFLESIKHFFNVPGVHFVLFVCHKSLEKILKNKYGEDTDFENWLRKIVNLQFELTPRKNDGLDFSKSLLSLKFAGNYEPFKKLPPIPFEKSIQNLNEMLNEMVLNKTIEPRTGFQIADILATFLALGYRTSSLTATGLVLLYFKCYPDGRHFLKNNHIFPLSNPPKNLFARSFNPRHLTVDLLNYARSGGIFEVNYHQEALLYGKSRDIKQYTNINDAHPSPISFDSIPFYDSITPVEAFFNNHFDH